MSDDKPEIIRVLRIIEYVGPRAAVEDIVANSINGQKRVAMATHSPGVVIRAATIGQYPEILDAACVIQKLTQSQSSKDGEMFLVVCGELGCMLHNCGNYSDHKHELGSPCLRGRTVSK